MKRYFRPLVQSGRARPDGAVALAGGALWFTHVEHLSRDRPPEVLPAEILPPDWHAALTEPRIPLAGLSLDTPRVMGILNVTPDSFSDGGQHHSIDAALTRARDMQTHGVDILDIGGESTRPGAEPVPVAQEIDRTAPVIARLRRQTDLAISIDTRKAAVAQAALENGATLVNDVSGFTHDPELVGVAQRHGAAVCVMHAQGDPATMQQNPSYDNVLLDVYDTLSERIDLLTAQGIARGQIVIDPGIGFGKTQSHNLTLLRGISLFHGLGCAILLGVSRKGFIGALGKAPDPATRAPGSIALGLAALAQGVQILRVHDVKETTQALALWQAVR